MPPKRKPTNIEKARHYLSGGSVIREDSDDEIGMEEHPWDFIYTSEDNTSGDAADTRNGQKRIIGARMGELE